LPFQGLGPEKVRSLRASGKTKHENEQRETEGEGERGGKKGETPQKRNSRKTKGRSKAKGSERGNILRKKKDC